MLEIKRLIPFIAKKQMEHFKKLLKLKCNNAFYWIDLFYSANHSNLSREQIIKLATRSLKKERSVNRYIFYEIIKTPTNTHFIKKENFNFINPNSNFKEGLISINMDGKPSLCYAKYFDPLKLLVTTCISKQKLTYETQKRVAEYIALRNFSEKNNRYIFINDTRGNIVVIYNKVFVGKHMNLWDIAKNKKEKRLIELIFKKEMRMYNSPHGGFITYQWYEPKTGKIGKKISFIASYKPFKWVIGEGFYTGEANSAVKSILSKVKMEIDSISKRVKSYSLAIFAVLLVLLSSISFLLNKYLKNLFGSFEKHFKEGTHIDKNKYLIEEVKNIVTYINSAIDKFKEYENEFLEALVYAIESKDPYTKGHSQRVAVYSKLIAKELDFNEEKQDELYKAALLHDIGKIGIPDNILLKPGKLTPNEYRIMQYHSIFSYEIVSKINKFKKLAIHIRQHHERCDGSGYPDGITCDKITTQAKIIAIADVFDALTSERPYRDKLPPDKAIEILKKDSLDKTILSKIENKLPLWHLEEENIEYKTELIEEVDRIRKEIFEIDYMTGLKRRKSTISMINRLIKQQESFALFFVDVMELSTINYKFSTNIGDKIIIYTSIALSDIEANCSNCDSLSRAYNDAFLFIFRKRNCNEAKILRKKIKEELPESVARLIRKDEEIPPNTAEEIIEMLNFHVIYACYPADSTTAEGLIYRCMQQKKKQGSPTRIHHISS